MLGFISADWPMGANRKWKLTWRGPGFKVTRTAYAPSAMTALDLVRRSVPEEKRRAATNFVVRRAEEKPH